MENIDCSYLFITQPICTILHCFHLFFLYFLSLFIPFSLHVLSFFYFLYGRLIYFLSVQNILFSRFPQIRVKADFIPIRFDVSRLSPLYFSISCPVTSFRASLRAFHPDNSCPIAPCFIKTILIRLLPNFIRTNTVLNLSCHCCTASPASGR